MRSVFFIASTFSAWLRCRFFCVNASDAVKAIEPDIVSLVAEDQCPVEPVHIEPQPGIVDALLRVNPATTSSASAHPGTMRGLTNEAAWI